MESVLQLGSGKAGGSVVQSHWCVFSFTHTTKEAPLCGFGGIAFRQPGFQEFSRQKPSGLVKSQSQDLNSDLSES